MDRAQAIRAEQTAQSTSLAMVCHTEQLNLEVGFNLR
jgi:hypothetical protein